MPNLISNSQIKLWPWLLLIKLIYGKIVLSFTF
jgi:hypothetical protein